MSDERLWELWTRRSYADEAKELFEYIKRLRAEKAKLNDDLGTCEEAYRRCYDSLSNLYYKECDKVNRLSVELAEIKAAIVEISPEPDL